MDEGSWWLTADFNTAAAAAQARMRLEAPTPAVAALSAEHQHAEQRELLGQQRFPAPQRSLTTLS